MTADDFDRSLEGAEDLYDWADRWGELAIEARAAGEPKRAGDAARIAMIGAPHGSTTWCSLRATARASYLEREDTQGTETVDAGTFGREPCHVLLDVPAEGTCVGIIVLVPGLPEQIERYHRFTMQANGLGYAVVRIEVPLVGPIDGDRVDDFVRRTAAAGLDRCRARTGFTGAHHMVGRSLGGIFTLYHAAELPPRSLTTISVPTNWRSVYDETSPILQRGWWHDGNVETLDELVDRLPFEAVAARIHCPCLIVHGGLDSYADPRDMFKLHDTIPGPSRTMLLPFHGHRIGRGMGKIFRKALDFIVSVDAGAAR